MFLMKKIINLKNNKKGSPLIEESVLIGLSLFTFLIIAQVVFDIIGFAQSIFDAVSKSLSNIPK